MVVLCWLRNMAECPFPVLRRVKADFGVKEHYVQTPCGICEVCRKNFAHMWGTRVYHESLMHDKNCFVTLTYSPDNMPLSKTTGIPTIDISDVQLFLKRWREYIYPDKIRYFCGCEYSPLNHLPHYHIAVFGADLWDKRVFTGHYPRDDGYSVECRFWDKGFVHVGNLEIGSACYVAGYALKKVMGSANKDYYKNLGIVAPRALMSRNPGIGASFMLKNQDALRRLGSVCIENWVVNLPRYYADKLDVKNTDSYLQRYEKVERRNLEAFDKAFESVFKLQDNIRSRLNAQEFYRDRDNFHKRLVKDFKI